MRQGSTCMWSLEAVHAADMIQQLRLRKEKELKGYSCKQLLKDPDLTFHLDLESRYTLISLWF